jgi:molybdopterin synthase catalytic subunit
MTARFVLTPEPLDERSVVASRDGRASGGIVTFSGRVRERSRGRIVTRLEYEAYPEMAQAVFARIGDEAMTKFGVDAVAIHHRTGVLAVGETSVVIAVSAPHRAAAFEACRFAIDRLKQIAPIWKKEHFEGGAVWVDDRP